MSDVYEPEYGTDILARLRRPKNDAAARAAGYDAAIEIERLRAALEGALVILESMHRPTAGLISNNVQAEFDRRLAAVRAALGYQQK